MIKRFGLLWGIVLLSGMLVGNPAQGAPPPQGDELVKQAVENLQKENYEEALAQLTEAWRKGPHTPEKAFYLGVVYRQLLDYPKAREYLEEAVRLKPDYMEARRLLADTLITLDKPDLAVSQLAEMEKAGYQPAQTAMMQGLVAVKQKRYKEALEYFHKAETDPALAQDAKLQISLVLAAQNRLKEAQKILKETINLAPNTSTATFADRYASALEKRLEEVRPFRFNVYAGLDYDTNVTLQPGGGSSATQVSGKGDATYSYGGYMEYNLFPNGPFGLIGNYAFYMNFHPRIPTFDLVSHTVGLTPTYQFEKSRLWMPFTYNYTDVQSDKYYTAFVLTPTYLYLLSPNVGLELGGRVSRKYYWFPTSFPQDNRNAKNLGSSVGLYYFFKNQTGFLQARFSYEHDFAFGSNWENSNYRLYLAILYPFTTRLKANIFLDMSLQPYNFFFFNGVAYDNKRYDKNLITGITLAYDIWKGINANIHYYYIRDNSNIGIYNYSRQIVGLQLGYNY